MIGSVFLSSLIGINHASVFLNLAIRLLLPMLIIISYESQKGLIEKNYLYDIIRYWSLIFPLTIIFPYILGLGFDTYGAGTAGYKGFYYAQNDIGYILAILYLFTLYEISKGYSVKKIITFLLLLVSNLVLGLKSNYMLVAAFTLCYIFSVSKKHNPQLSKIFLMIMIALGLFLISNLYANEINAIVNRWTFFYGSRETLSFFTSSRSDRIPLAYNWVISTYGIIGFLFGSGAEYTFHSVINEINTIEMDLFDLFFQLGLVGMLSVVFFYLKVFKDNHFKNFYFVSFVMSFVIGSLAGHVFESALSGMFFSVICTAGILENRVQKGKTVWQTEQRNQK